MADGLAAALQTVGLLVLVALPASTLGGAAIFLPRQIGFWTLAHWGRMFGSHGIVVASLLLMLVPEVLESQLDPVITAALPAAMQTWPTSFIAGFEGGFHETLQDALPWTWLRLVFTAVYVAGYPFLIVTAIMLPVLMDRGRLARRAVAAYALSFAIALPFYLFFPVNEVWFYDGRVENIINSYPLVRQHLYSFNDINNCFPSLHTGISAVLALLVWRSDMPRRFRVMAVTLASGIVLSTMYLGIHWVVDVVAGLVLAVGIAALVARIWPDPPAAAPSAQPAKA